ncbi:PREDICTED: zinc finger BED domain-containing protein 1-like [Amphimedon queenslandica]|uniref:BED-type domain-containing protein n=1 Tax=Amphimedon queenslandica TaxID=400682 RepID=A0A1X7TWK6_AMPQE|nr:PREDICTED: zinc finger BED domain-containing protein 1-like [Amphimedon queenslandica]|eukprot:XP_011406608.1 PREDICTED: zinc finger BED domain-containing protein 1-like [Amphimedon queenslandica]
MAANIVSPTGRSSLVWKYFGFAKDCDGTLSKEKAVCKLCSQKVAHGGGTTNMKNHLKTKHLAEFNMLYQEEPTTSSQSSLDAFIVSKSVKKFSANSEMAKKLNEGLADFITRDLRPVSVVDGAGFLNLMHLAEPRYTVPCRKSLMEIIDSRYNDMKRSVCGVVSQQEFITLTSDMWTSRAGDGFISLTAHYLTDTFDLEHKTLQCLPLPGHHDHTSISSAITCCTGNWLIDIAKNVTAFTTDNGSNIVKAVEEDLKCIRIPCTGHTLNLSVSAGLEVNAISKVIARSKKVVTHFNQSRIDREQLAQ